jgi:hypothetical protein
VSNNILYTDQLSQNVQQLNNVRLFGELILLREIRHYTFLAFPEPAMKDLVPAHLNAPA